MSYKKILKLPDWLKKKNLIKSIFYKARQYRIKNSFSDTGLAEMEVEAQNWNETELKTIEEEFDRCL